MAIDKNAEHPSVRKLFKVEEGKKCLSVNIGSLSELQSGEFIQEISKQIARNLDNPDYIQIMEADFSQSTSTQKIVNSIMLMNSFQKYFEYEVMYMCGIPGLVLLGEARDWRSMLDKLHRLRVFLSPVEEILGLAHWFQTCKKVLQKLLETFEGNPDCEWWSNIITFKEPFGSGQGIAINIEHIKQLSNSFVMC